MKILHWMLNAALILAGLVCFWIMFKTPDTTNKIGCVATGLAFLGIGGVFCWYTWKKG